MLAYLPTFASPEVQEPEPQSELLGGRRHRRVRRQAWYSGSGSTFENTIGAQIGLVQQGLASPEDALATAHDLLTTYANTKRPRCDRPTTDPPGEPHERRSDTVSTTDIETKIPSEESAPPRSTRRSEAGPAWLFIAPFGIFFVLFLIWPVIYMFISSLFDTTLVRSGLGDFVGFGNYAR